MGADTKGFLRKEVTATEVYNVIATKFDREAIYDIRTDRDGEMGSIIFKYNDEDRSLFYCVTSDIREGTEFDSMPHVSLILGMWGSSVHIMTEIVKEFGGYVDENDCDGIGAVYIDSTNSFEYSEYVKERNALIEIMDENLSDSVKFQIAAQIIKHKDKLKELI